jgi:hypothetical protein
LDVLAGREIHIALSYYCRRLQYLRALAAGGPRFNLVGEPVGEVSESDKAGAAAAIEDILKRRENQRDQAKKKNVEARRAALTAELAKPNLARKIRRWTMDHAVALGDADPTIPESIFNRAADNWRPLLAVADAIGGEWPEKARTIATGAVSEADAGDTDVKLAVLADIKAIFDEGIFVKERTQGDKTVRSIHSDTLVKALVEIEGTRWAEYNHGKSLTQTGLSHLLSDYGPKPYQMRIGGVSKKGYDVADFDDAFASYLVSSLPSTPVQSETPKQSSGDSDLCRNQTETSFETNSKLSETSGESVSDGVSVQGSGRDCFGSEHR